MFNVDRSEVTHLAHSFKNQGMSWETAMQTAWGLFKEESRRLKSLWHMALDGGVPVDPVDLRAEGITPEEGKSPLIDGNLDQKRLDAVEKANEGKDDPQELRAKALKALQEEHDKETYKLLMKKAEEAEQAWVYALEEIMELQDLIQDDEIMAYERAVDITAEDLKSKEKALKILHSNRVPEEVKHQIPSVVIQMVQENMDHWLNVATGHILEEDSWTKETHPDWLNTFSPEEGVDLLSHLHMAISRNYPEDLADSILDVIVQETMELEQSYHESRTKWVAGGRRDLAIEAGDIDLPQSWYPDNPDVMTWEAKAKKVFALPEKNKEHFFQKAPYSQERTKKIRSRVEALRQQAEAATTEGPLWRTRKLLQEAVSYVNSLRFGSMRPPKFLGYAPPVEREEVTVDCIFHGRETHKVILTTHKEGIHQEVISHKTFMPVARDKATRMKRGQKKTLAIPFLGGCLRVEFLETYTFISGEQLSWEQWALCTNDVHQLLNEVNEKLGLDDPKLPLHVVVFLQKETQ